MTVFKVNEGLDDEREIEARAFRPQGSFTVFIGEGGEQLFAIPSKHIETIERVPED